MQRFLFDVMDDQTVVIDQIGQEKRWSEADRCESWLLEFREIRSQHLQIIVDQSKCLNDSFPTDVRNRQFTLAKEFPSDAVWIAAVRTAYFSRIENS